MPSSAVLPASPVGFYKVFPAVKDPARTCAQAVLNPALNPRERKTAVEVWIRTVRNSAPDMPPELHVQALAKALAKSVKEAIQAQSPVTIEQKLCGVITPDEYVPQTSDIGSPTNPTKNRINFHPDVPVVPTASDSSSDDVSNSVSDENDSMTSDVISAIDFVQYWQTAVNNIATYADAYFNEQNIDFNSVASVEMYRILKQVIENTPDINKFADEIMQPKNCNALADDLFTQHCENFATRYRHYFQLWNVVMNKKFRISDITRDWIYQNIGSTVVTIYKKSLDLAIREKLLSGISHTQETLATQFNALLSWFLQTMQDERLVSLETWRSKNASNLVSYNECILQDWLDRLVDARKDLLLGFISAHLPSLDAKPNLDLFLINDFMGKINIINYDLKSIVNAALQCWKFNDTQRRSTINQWQEVKAAIDQVNLKELVQESAKNKLQFLFLHPDTNISSAVELTNRHVRLLQLMQQHWDFTQNENRTRTAFYQLIESWILNGINALQELSFKQSAQNIFEAYQSAKSRIRIMIEFLGALLPEKHALLYFEFLEKLIPLNEKLKNFYENSANNTGKTEQVLSGKKRRVVILKLSISNRNEMNPAVYETIEVRTINRYEGDALKYSRQTGSLHESELNESMQKHLQSIIFYSKKEAQHYFTVMTKCVMPILLHEFPVVLPRNMTWSRLICEKHAKLSHTIFTPIKILIDELLRMKKEYADVNSMMIWKIPKIEIDRLLQYAENLYWRKENQTGDIVQPTHPVLLSNFQRLQEMEKQLAPQTPSSTMSLGT